MTDRMARLAAAALIYGAVAGAAQAQETFSAGSNHNETFSGANSSNRTGTQGVVGNPNCAPPVEIINGRRVTPLNWSCDSSGYWASRAPNIKAPFGAPHPGPAYVPGAANPCQPGGPGGYNWLNNPVGTRLPPGCVRPAGRAVISTKGASTYEPAPPSRYIVPPAGPPGSYIQPEGKPGDYMVPPQGAPGSYLQPDGRPGSYLDSTAKNNPGGSNSQTHTSPDKTATRSSGTNQKASDGLGRQDTDAMRGELFNAGAPSSRQDTRAMQAGLSGGQVVQKPAKAAAVKNIQTQKNAAAKAAADAQAARIVNTIINAARNGP